MTLKQRVSARARQILGRHSHRPGVLRFLSRLLPWVVRPFLNDPAYLQYFQTWEDAGFHLTRNHFYGSIPDRRLLKDELWQREFSLDGIDMREEKQLALLRDAFPRYRSEYDSFADEPTGVPHDFYFNNQLFSGTDALVHYCMVRHFQPRTVLEVGGGFSTRIAAAAALRNGTTEVRSIEPYPDPVLATGFPGLTELIRSEVQDVPLDTFARLASNDILFIDSTHAVKTGGDVTYLYLRVLPQLKPGVIVHFHDIFLPLEYPREWVVDQKLFWTEQYLLHAFLLFNREFEVLMANTYLDLRHPDEFRRVFPKSPWWGGGSFWIRRREVAAGTVEEWRP
jgi:hypothetical protein